jgi:hypothetical protein
VLGGVSPGVHEGAQGGAAVGLGRRDHRVLAHRQDQSGTAFAAQRFERGPRRRAAIDDHRADRRTGRRLDGPLPAGVDLNQLEEGAEHALETPDDRASPGAGELVEGRRQ